MRIHNSAHARHFTVLANSVLRDRRLSFTARGILCHLLSLPDGAREDVRTLADRNPRLGRRGVAQALDELIQYGYYVRRTHRDETTGRLRTETYVYESPPGADRADGAEGPPTGTPTGSPTSVRPGTGRAAGGKAGASPEGEKNQEKEPSPKEPDPAREPGPGPVEAGAGAGAQKPELLARAAALLARLGVHEPKLALSAADSLTLAPMAARWLDRGVTELETRSLLADGLPPVVHAPKSFLAARLERKLPAHRTSRDAAAPAAPPAECADCRDPLPSGQTTGICGECAGVVRTGDRSLADPAPAPLAADLVPDRVGHLRALLRGGRPAPEPS
ncbi:helix-turn-helix domain-containing protein [Streptomyces sp. NBC_01267]|uniref:helix-turn-helix domain-containing protein n=1 Tax=unclassified Streptomyces TaxID=2593676 RepID=UPI002251304C|nr:MULTISPECIES: helix-turn-helix domain-containing protein [unclassified Streptomyces]MCX4550883.1 helix-turn-helix domain-containing protein [Streptomyces sp. NBC_01500]